MVSNTIVLINPFCNHSERTMFKEILAASVIGAVGLTASGAHAVAADDRPAAATGTQKVETTNLRYSDEDVISFFVLHAGPVFDARPDLATQLGYVRTHPSAETVSAVMKLFRQADPQLHERVTEAVQSGDPVRTEAGLRALTDDFNKVVERIKESRSQKGTVSPLDYNNGPVSNFVDTITFVAAAAVVLGAVAAVAGAVVFVLYTPDSTATAYDRQLNALAVAKSLG
ncbi:hypothetical protein [Arthrobacter sp.]|uniref:hypothetical protein n=1 Tax=Arthrobacter sp. TaxID=1667 RepID=UPI002582CCA0|nr:hypothetical protein [Arthrobacter sp.]